MWLSTWKALEALSQLWQESVQILETDYLGLDPGSVTCQL